MNLLARSPLNCAKAFNLFLVLFIVRLLLNILFTAFPPLALSVSLVLAVLIVYLAYHCGWHPLLAVLLLGAWLLPPYGPFAVLILTLIQTRIYLQNHGYAVRLMSAHESAEGVAFSPPIALRHYRWWLMIFAAPAWVLFVVMWMINPDYADKFFQPFQGRPLFGVSMLFAALVCSGLIYPLGMEFRRLLAVPKVTGTVVVQFFFVLSLTLLFSLMSVSIIVLTPAAMTMMQQMGLVSDHHVIRE